MYKLTLLFVLAAFFVGFSIGRVTDRDYKTYQELLVSSAPIKNPLVSKQAREGVLKEIWTQNHHIRIESATSELHFSQKDGQMKVSEQLGIASLKMEDGSQLECDKALLDYANMTSHFTGAPQVSYCDERGEVWADEAYVDYTQTEGSIKPSKIRLIDNVQLIYLESDQYALADLVTYYPEEKLTILEAKEGNRVLFFDKGRNMQLSAPCVHATRKKIQGIGDVRFVFGQDELSKLKGHFKW